MKLYRGVAIPFTKGPVKNFCRIFQNLTQANFTVSQSIMAPQKNFDMLCKEMTEATVKTGKN